MHYTSSRLVSCTIPEGSGKDIEVQVVVGQTESEKVNLFDYDGMFWVLFLYFVSEELLIC